MRADAARRMLAVEWFSPGQTLDTKSPPDALTLRQTWEPVSALPPALAALAVAPAATDTRKVVIEEDRFEFYHDSVANFVWPDAAAPNGYAGVIDFSDGWWSTLRCPVEPDMLPAPQYNATVFMRLAKPDASAGDVAIVNMGKRSLTVKADQLQPTGWTAIDLGPVQPAPGMYMTVVTPQGIKRPNQILVDRIECLALPTKEDQ